MYFNEKIRIEIRLIQLSGFYTDFKNSFFVYWHNVRPKTNPFLLTLD
jgi:hypothetical protein